MKLHKIVLSWYIYFETFRVGRWRCRRRWRQRSWMERVLIVTLWCALNLNCSTFTVWLLRGGWWCCHFFWMVSLSNSTTEWWLIICWTWVLQQQRRPVMLLLLLRVAPPGGVLFMFITHFLPISSVANFIFVCSALCWMAGLVDRGKKNQIDNKYNLMWKLSRKNKI